MNKIFIILIASSILFSQYYYGSTTAAVTLVGGIIKAKHIQEEISTKYKRKDCPVCKGKGWYISGDDIQKINCQYCEDTASNKEIKISKPIYIQK